MLNALLFAALSLNAATGINPDSSANKNVPLDEIVVTDFKQNKRNLTSTAVSTINVQQLHNQQIVNLKELTAIMPNFYMPDYGSYANTPVYIRGIGTKSKGSAVGFYVDGVPHFESSAFNIDLSDIAAVNVFRGPQGTLYGRNTIAGIINVYTHNPLDYQRTRIKVGYGRYNDFIAQASNYAKISEKFGISTAASYHHNDGMFTNHFLNEKADKLNEGEGRIGLYWRPTTNWLLHINSTLTYSEQNGYPYAPYDIVKDELLPISYNRNSTYRRLISSTGLNAQYENNHISFNSQTSYQFIKSHQGLDQDFTPQDVYFVDNSYHQNMLSQELTLKSNDKGRYQWIIGLFGMLLHSNQFAETSYFTRDFSTPTTYKNPTAGYAIYHQSSYNIWRGLSTTVGLRFDYEHAKTTYNQDKTTLSTGVTTHAKDFVSSASFRQFTPKFTLQYLTNKDNLYYISITRGYKPGGFNTIFKTDAERTYAPEYSWNYEVGTRLKFFNGRLTAEADLFYIDWRHMQTTYTVPGVGNVIANAGHTDSKGFELSLAYHPIKSLQLNLNYGYTHARYLEYKKSAREDFSGNRLPMVPNHTLSLNGTYTIMPAGWFDKIVFNTGLTGLGRIYWADDNIVRQNFYATLNAKVSLTKGIFTWEVWGKNLTATNYMAYGFKASQGNYAQRGKPLTFGTAVSVSF
ncbi:TonB-dependent receptor [Prevotella histicola]|jgi:tonB-dependent receptor plug domain protein|uniref:TonB-dependent receptor n=1 Tax=Prevotella histicola TaxID=470565 RepID=A0A930HZ42_9BACT|nr:TonB-dependent receptor [Prevotella histicola]MBF1415085.1 TonB-dependent receptor [Prevotella histicola]MBW4711122.1 TonB-dependent receptor [Prevotella histicola]MBW4875616.1 TonB-dependent receptor [Prevotella histicola]MBW4919920.1 TonB-dependent receptor [Prevotella histicola]